MCIHSRAPKYISFLVPIVESKTKKNYLPRRGDVGNTVVFVFRRPVAPAQGGRSDQGLMGLLPNINKYGLCVSWSPRHASSRYTVLARSWTRDFYTALGFPGAATLGILISTPHPPRFPPGMIACFPSPKSPATLAIYNFALQTSEGSLHCCPIE